MLATLSRYNLVHDNGELEAALLLYFGIINDNSRLGSHNEHRLSQCVYMCLPFSGGSIKRNRISNILLSRSPWRSLVGFRHIYYGGVSQTLSWHVKIYNYYSGWVAFKESLERSTLITGNWDKCTFSSVTVRRKKGASKIPARSLPFLFTEGGQRKTFIVLYNTVKQI